MKIILLMVFVSLLILNIVFANPEITVRDPPQQNGVEGNSLILRFQTPLLYDFENSTAHILYKQGIAMVGYEYVCWDNGERGALNSCWTATVQSEVTSENIFSGARGIRLTGFGGDANLEFNPPTTNNLTIEGFMSPNGSSQANNWFGAVFSYDLGGDLDIQQGGSGNHTFDSTVFNFRTTVSTSDINTKFGNWTYFELNGKEQTMFLVGNNYTNVANFTASKSTPSFTHKVWFGAFTNNIGYADNIRIYNSTSNRNMSATINAFKTAKFNDIFNQVNFTFYGNGTELIFSCNNNTPSQKITVNNSQANCTNFQRSQELTVWLNHTSPNANATFANITTSFSSLNIVPSISLNNPPNNNATHNKTIMFNFTITDADGDKFNLTLYSNVTSNPSLIINQSGNMTNDTFIIIYTFNVEINGSINNTYYWKVNGTDNNSNFFQSSISTFNITNNLDDITNVTLNSSVINVGDFLKGYFNLTGILRNNRVDYDNCSINQTRLYINFTEVLGHRNETILNGSFARDGANITFSARCNDGFGETSWTPFVNSTTLTVSDTTFPTILGANFSKLSITDGEQVNVTVNATDNNFLNIVNITVRSPTGILFNRTCLNINAISYLCNITFFDGDETSESGNWNLTYVNISDNSNNYIASFPNSTLIVNPVAGGGGVSGTSGGGGGGGTTTVIEKLIGSIPILFFGGITTTDFIVISTPRKQAKTLRFTNLGNTSFENAIIFIEGDAKKYVNPFVCDLNLQNCRNTSIFVRPQESLFLQLNGTFTQELGLGTQGVIKLQERKENGRTHEINLLIARPPLYKIAIKPFSNFTNLNEFQSLIAVYFLTSLVIITTVYIALI